MMYCNKCHAHVFTNRVVYSEYVDVGTDRTHVEYYCTECGEYLGVVLR